MTPAAEVTDPVDADHDPLPRRWVHSRDLATLVKHMGPVIPEAEWEAAVASPATSVPGSAI